MSINIQAQRHKHSFGIEPLSLMLMVGLLNSIPLLERQNLMTPNRLRAGS